MADFHGLDFRCRIGGMASLIRLSSHCCISGCLRTQGLWLRSTEHPNDCLLTKQTAAHTHIHTHINIIHIIHMWAENWHIPGHAILGTVQLWAFLSLRSRCLYAIIHYIKPYPTSCSYTVSLFSCSILLLGFFYVSRKRGASQRENPHIAPGNSNLSFTKGNVSLVCSIFPLILPAVVGVGENEWEMKREREKVQSISSEPISWAKNNWDKMKG